MHLFRDGMENTLECMTYIGNVSLRKLNLRGGLSHLPTSWNRD